MKKTLFSTTFRPPQLWSGHEKLGCELVEFIVMLPAQVSSPLEPGTSVGAHSATELSCQQSSSFNNDALPKRTRIFYNDCRFWPWRCLFIMKRSVQVFYHERVFMKNMVIVMNVVIHDEREHGFRCHDSTRENLWKCQFMLYPTGGEPSSTRPSLFCWLLAGD